MLYTGLYSLYEILKKVLLEAEDADVKNLVLQGILKFCGKCCQMIMVCFPAFLRDRGI